MPLNETPEEKKHRIQTGVVKRLIKEHRSYIDEAKKGEAQISVMKNGPDPDEYKLKKAAECVMESRGMIVDACRRLQQAMHDLKDAQIALNKPEDHQLNMDTEELFKLADAELRSSKV